MTHRAPLCSARAPRWLAALGLLLLTVFSAPLAAQSGFSNLRVVPNPAPANTHVVARLFGQPCRLGQMRVDVEGRQVRLVPVGITLCFSAAAPPSDFDLPLGAFSPGTYTLTVPVGGDPPSTLTTTFLVLADATPIPVANHPATLAALAVSLMLLAAFASRRH